jgi:hypothetical protein
VRLFIKEWVNKTATIMTENGQVVWTFSSIQDARTACREWQTLSDAEPVTCLEEISGGQEQLACAAG